MINLKTTRELRYMRDAGKISQEALLKAGEAVRPGVSTLELDKIVRRTIEKAGAVPSFLGYGGFPASACISVNNVVIHGIPDKRVIKAGDIVSVDVGAFYNGYHGDNAATFAAGEVSPEAQALMERVDARRASYYNYYSSRTWGVASTYHLCVSSSVLGDEGTADFILEFAARKLHEKM